MAITRTIYATVIIRCCKNGVDIYHSAPQYFRSSVTEDCFDNSLVMWRDKAVAVYREYLYQHAKYKYETMGLLKLYKFEMKARVEETDYIAPKFFYYDRQSDLLRMGRHIQLR